MKYLTFINDNNWKFNISEKLYNEHKEYFDSGKFRFQFLQTYLHNPYGPALEYDDIVLYFLNGKKIQHNKWLIERDRYIHNEEFNNKFNNLIGND